MQAAVVERARGPPDQLDFAPEPEQADQRTDCQEHSKHERGRQADH
jgi:hypothetical protein